MYVEDEYDHVWTRIRMKGRALAGPCGVFVRYVVVGNILFGTKKKRERQRDQCRVVDAFVAETRVNRRYHVRQHKSYPLHLFLLH